ncbi:MAG: MaoC/PaaZ C-terminal domain-containing protein [Rhodoblastus sp.]
MKLPVSRGDTMPETIVGPFDAAAVAAYAAASGDDNPLHLDAALAARAGFAAPPVHGMRLMAEIAPALAAWRPDMALKRLSATFVEPLLVGEEARLTARVLRAEGDVLMRIAIQGPRRGPSVLAEAVLVARAGAS